MEKTFGGPVTATKLIRRVIHAAGATIHDLNNSREVRQAMLYFTLDLIERAKTDDRYRAYGVNLQQQVNRLIILGGEAARLGRG